jgi:transposase
LPATPAPLPSRPARARSSATGCTAAGIASSTARCTFIALSRANTDPETRAYLERKHAEGKTKLEAIRCLKRHLARRIWHLLYAAETAPSPSVLINRSNPEIPTFT